MIQKLTLWAAGNPRTEEAQLVLQLTEEVEKLRKQIENFKVVAYARKNEKGDLYDLRLQNNPCVDQSIVAYLYEYQENGQMQNVQQQK